MLVFLLCVAVVVASVSGSGYLEDREYHYKYYGNVNAHFPDKSNQVSAVAFVSDVVIQPHADYWIIKLDHPKYDKANEEIGNVDAHEFDYKPISSAVEHITKPFQVTFQKGQVKSYKVPEDEPEWSVNIKRGLLTMLNLNLNQDDSFHTGDEKVLHKPHPNANYYKVMEDGVTGECETLYTITVEPYELTPYYNNVLNVSKTRNYHNCLHMPLWEYESISGYDCHSCGHEDKPESHHANADFYYELRGDRHNYIIEYAESLGDVVFNPYRQQSAAVHTNRTLHLKEEVERQAELHLDNNLITHYSLIYKMIEKKEFKKPVDLKKPHYLHDIYLYTPSVQEIEKLFLDLVKVYDDHDSYFSKMKKEHVPGKFLELVRAVQTVGYETLEQLYKDLGDAPLDGANEEQRLKRQLFVDVLMVTGTNPAFLLSKKLIQSNSLPHKQITYLLQKLPYHIKEVSESLLDEFYRMCEHKEVKDSDILHTSCYLSFTTLVFDACVADYHETSTVDVDKTRCTPEIASKYFNYLTSEINHDASDKHKIAYMRAISNLGTKEVVDYLEPYLHDRHHYPVYHRVSAVWALHRVLDTHPEKVLPLIFPIYIDTSEDHEVRIAAFTLLMAADLSLYHIETIARYLPYDDNDQVKYYVQSTFHYLMESHHPCHQKISNMIKKVSYMLEDYTHHIGNSFNFYSAGYEDSYDHGGFTHLAVIASNTSYVPRSGFLRINDYLWGESMDTLAIGFHAHGLEKFFDRIFGPKGVFHGRSVLDLLRTRTPRDAQEVKLEMDNIDKQLHMETREYEPIQGDVFIQILGNNFAMFQFDEETFNSFFHDGKVDIPHLPEKFNELGEFMHERFLLPMDRVYVFPNEAGMPVVLDYKVPIFVHFKNNDIGVDVNNAEIALKVDSHWLMDKEHILTLSVLMPYDHVHVGAGIHRRSMLSLPVKAELSFNLIGPKFNLKWHPVVPHEIYHHHYDAFTFSDSVSDHKPIVLAENYLPLNKEETLKTWEGHFFHDYLGLGLDVKTGYDNIWNDRISWTEFMKDNDFREKLYYFISNPYFNTYTFDVALTPDDKDITNEVDAEWTYEFHDLEDPEPHLTEFLPDDILEDDVKPHRDIKFHTHVLKSEIVAKGLKERKVHGEIAYTHTLDFLYHKLNLYYDRSPFHQDEKEHLKICMLGAANFPKHDYKTLYTLETDKLDHSLNTSLHINFGNKCQGDHKITIRGHHTRTEEQEDLDHKRASEDDSNYYSTMYQNCKSDRDEGHFYSSDCIEYLREVTKLLNHVWEIDYENIPVAMRNLTYKVSQRFKNRYFINIDEDAYDVHNPPNKIRIEANYSVEDPILDVRVFKPYETTFYNKLYASYDSLHIPYSTFPMLDFTSLGQLIKYDDYPYCLLEKDSVNTYDNIEFELPSIDCYKVISKDCSPHEHFMVLGKKVDHSRYSKALKIYLGKWKIELFPMKDESKLTVQVNGKKVPVTEEKCYVESDHGQDVFHLRFNGAFYTLHSDKYGLIVHFDGRAILVKVSAFYRGKVCGLCGDFNHESNHEFLGPENCLYPNATTFAYSYVIEEENCHVPKTEHACIPQHVEGCTVLRNRMVQITQNQIPHVCFSTHPVPKCSPGCEESRHVTKKIPFHCLPASDTFTNFLKKESIHRVLHEVKRKSPDHHAEVDYPERCDKTEL